MAVVLVVVAVVVVVALVGLSLSLRIVKQYEEGVLFRLGRVVAIKKPGLIRIVPVIDVLRRVSLRIMSMPTQSKGIITRDNLRIDVSPGPYSPACHGNKSMA